MKPEPQRVVGVVLASTITDVTVYREEEKSIEEGKETIFIKTEALHLGLAIRAELGRSPRSSSACTRDGC